MGAASAGSCCLDGQRGRDQGLRGGSAWCEGCRPGCGGSRGRGQYSWYSGAGHGSGGPRGSGCSSSGGAGTAGSSSRWGGGGRRIQRGPGVGRQQGREGGGPPRAQASAAVGRRGEQEWGGAGRCRIQRQRWDGRREQLQRAPLMSLGVAEPVWHGEYGEGGVRGSGGARRGAS